MGSGSSMTINAPLVEIPPMHGKRRTIPLHTLPILSLVRSARLLRNEEFQSYLGVCASSWEPLAGEIRSDLRCRGAVVGHVSFDDQCQGGIANSNAREGAKHLLIMASKKYKISMILVVLRYIVRLQGVDTKRLLLALKSLGREHSRIYVSEADLYDLSDIIVMLLKDALVETHSHTITAWAAVLKYIVYHMCEEKYVFKDHNGSSSLIDKGNQQAASNKRKSVVQLETIGEQQCACANCSESSQYEEDTVVGEMAT